MTSKEMMEKLLAKYLEADAALTVMCAQRDDAREERDREIEKRVGYQKDMIKAREKLEANGLKY